MADEGLLILGRVNLAVAVAVALVLALRGLVRRLCGADVAYTIWVLPPIAGLAMALWALLTGPAAQSGVRQALEAMGPALVAVWLAGVGAGAIYIGLSHRRTRDLARRGELGPAVVGLLHPRVRLPHDFETTYDAAERTVIRAHERAHLLRHDALVNHALAVAQCVFWFNPLVHLGCLYARRDQEMACDMTVMEERPEKRAIYARTLLKAQLKGEGLLLGCTWARHPLEERVRALATPPPVITRVAGIVALGAASGHLLVMFASSIH